MKKSQTFVTPGLVCPFCKHKMDRSSAVQDGGAPPKTGDISLCIRCGCAGIFTDKGALRKPTGEEMLQLATNKTVIQGQIFIAALPKSRS
jgi:hypothetical protein